MVGRIGEDGIDGAGVHVGRQFRAWRNVQRHVLARFAGGMAQALLGSRPAALLGESRKRGLHRVECPKLGRFEFAELHQAMGRGLGYAKVAQRRTPQAMRHKRPQLGKTAAGLPRGLHGLAAMGGHRFDVHAQALDHLGGGVLDQRRGGHANPAKRSALAASMPALTRPA